MFLSYEGFSKVKPSYPVKINHGLSWKLTLLILSIVGFHVLQGNTIRNWLYIPHLDIYIPPLIGEVKMADDTTF